MKLAELIRVAHAFVRTRWGLRFSDRAALERWQQEQLARFIDRVLPGAPFYRSHKGQPLAALPVVDKATTLREFAAFNTRGITLDDALAAALATERGTPLPAGFDATLSAGLSSGTQGPRGVFLATPRERATWAGILLARTLDTSLLRDLLLRRAPLRVAFFLRANSTLYTTLNSKRIDFRFFDLQDGAHTHLDPLAAFAPEVLVAPASVLAWFAQQAHAGRLALTPRRVISVAEVLEPADAASIEAAFGRRVHQLYQCTEGFLAYTCEHGTLHLNEEFVHVEPEWLDAAHTRFTPVVTDFTRRTQMIVRYRLTDILRVHDGRCPCGRATRALAAIDGRLDDVLWLRSVDDALLLPLFPDALRHAITRTLANGAEYRLEQHGDTLHLATDAGPRGDAAFATIVAAIDALATAQRMQPPAWQRIAMPAAAPAAKRRRIVCAQRPVLTQPAETGHDD